MRVHGEIPKQWESCLSPLRRSYLPKTGFLIGQAVLSYLHSVMGVDSAV